MIKIEKRFISQIITASLGIEIPYLDITFSRCTFHQRQITFCVGWCNYCIGQFMERHTQEYASCFSGLTIQGDIAKGRAQFLGGIEWKRTGDTYRIAIVNAGLVKVSPV